MANYDYTFEYETKQGRIVEIGVDLSLTAEGGCVGCGCRPCYHCRSYPAIDEARFFIGKHEVTYKKQKKVYDLIENAFNTDHTEKAIEAVCAD